MTGRKELDWTSPDWNKPLLPSPLFTTPHLPPNTAASCIYPGKNSGQAQCPQSQKSHSQGEGTSGAAFPPQPTATLEPHVWLGGLAGLTCFIGHHTMSSFRGATFHWNYTIKSRSATRDCCRGLKRSASPAYCTCRLCRILHCRRCTSGRLKR